MVLDRELYRPAIEHRLADINGGLTRLGRQCRATPFRRHAARRRRSGRGGVARSAGRAGIGSGGHDESVFGARAAGCRGGTCPHGPHSRRPDRLGPDQGRDAGGRLAVPRRGGGRARHPPPTRHGGSLTAARRALRSDHRRDRASAGGARTGRSAGILLPTGSAVQPCWRASSRPVGHALLGLREVGVRMSGAMNDRSCRRRRAGGRTPRQPRWPWLAACLLGLVPVGHGHAADPPWLGRLELPAGFAIRVFAEVPDARSLAVAEGGARIYVGPAAPRCSRCSTRSATVSPTRSCVSRIS
jgi:hypothetical protein